MGKVFGNSAPVVLFPEMKINIYLSLKQDVKYSVIMSNDFTKELWYNYIHCF